MHKLTEQDRETLVRNGAIVPAYDAILGRTKYLLPNGKVFAFEFLDDQSRSLIETGNRMIAEAVLRRIFHTRRRFRYTVVA